MARLLELPHTAGCVVCGRQNPHGLKLSLQVDADTAQVRCDFLPHSDHVGFEGIIHGGLLATVLDEAMVWAATWRGRRFCVSGELVVRFRQEARVGEKLTVTAEVETSRPRLIQAVGKIFNSQGELLATASGKYVPVTPDRHHQFVATLLGEATTVEALSYLRGG